MGSNCYEGRCLFALLTLLLLSACMYEKQDSNILDALGSYPKSITFDNEGNAYIATVSGRIARYDGQQLTLFLRRGTHGLDFAEEIRFANGILYIHNKRYVDRQTGYVDEVLMFSPDGEYIDRLISQGDTQSTMLGNIVVNGLGQLYSITDRPNIIRINYDKQNLISFEPSVLINLDVQRILDSLKKITDFDIPDKTITLSDILDETDITTMTDENSQITITDSFATQYQIVGINSLVSNDKSDNTTNIENALDEEKEPINILSLPEISLSAVNLLDLTDITNDMSGNIYISCLFGIFKFDRDGNYLKTVTMLNDHGLMLINNMTVDPFNNLIVASYDPRDASSMQYLKFDEHGNYIGKFISPDEAGLGLSIHDIMFDSAGNFYVVDPVKGIYKFDQTGQFEKIIIRSH